jgi:hypothetical protein
MIDVYCFINLNAIKSLKGIECHYCSNIVVLNLVELRWVQVALNLEPLKCLRSLEFHDVGGFDRLEGLGVLKNLTYFTRYHFDLTGKEVHTHVGQFPASLKVRVSTGPNVIVIPNLTEH